jgi:hypothetical protein
MEFPMSKPLALFCLVAILSTVASADMTFEKEGNKSIVLTIKKNRTAQITKQNKGKPGATVLIGGRVETQNSLLTILREEGDVCPSVSVELFNDIKLGENQAAEVKNKIEATGTAALKACGNISVMDGTYLRVR